MIIQKLRLSVLLPGLALALTAFAAPPKDVPAISIVDDYESAVAPRLEIQPDGAGNYYNSKALTSQIQAIGAWELDALNPVGATRTIRLDFSLPVAASGPGGGDPVGLPSGLYKFRAIAKCNAYGYSLLTQGAGTTIPCPLHIAFVYNGTQYAFQMNPYDSVNGVFPETNFATVKCIFPTSGTVPCSQWEFTPSGTYVEADNSVKYRNVAKLLKYTTSKGQTVALDQGDFYLSFHFVVAKT